MPWGCGPLTLFCVWPFVDVTRKQLHNRTNSFKFIDYFSTVVCVLEVQGSKCFISTVHILIFDVVYNLSTIAYKFSIQVPCKVKCDFWISNPPNLRRQKPGIPDFSWIGFKFHCDERNRSDFLNFTYDEDWD